ncbi:uncharacterized protein LOC119766753 [Culex quinquefasciatus]|uniref:uncharacterized protein LOC119766753 n=1 Tax=Culex quinquefasciatus TaxID=7176 RepID=UPI0018E3AA75|nr:uncharacterized protein LOC119766753 [Culex quinquefasciatus]
MPKRSKKTLRQKLAEVIEETSNDGKPRWNCKGNMEEELPCAYFQEKNFSPGNFKRHIVNKHPNIAGSLELDEPEEEKDASEPTPKKVQPDKVITKLTVSVSPADVLLGTIMLVAKSGLPLSFPEWEATKYTLRPLWDAAKLTVTRNTLPELIKKAARNMREIMSIEFKNKIICLKIDAASRNGRSVLGINAQFIDDAGNIQIRHIGKTIVFGYIFLALILGFAT